MRTREHKGFSHGLKDNDVRDINCTSCQAEDSAGIPAQLTDPIPDTSLYRAMATGHKRRTLHSLAGHLESTDGGQSWTLQRTCCADSHIGGEARQGHRDRSGTGCSEHGSDCPHS